MRGEGSWRRDRWFLHDIIENEDHHFISNRRRLWIILPEVRMPTRLNRPSPASGSLTLKLMEPAGSSKTLMVIPTRNRADLAATAIRSVLDQSVDDLHLIVSDNSTTEHDREALAAFCEELSDSRLLYIAPLRALSMTEHWEWAMSQALERYDDATHFTYLTDRSLFKPGELLNISKLAREHPQEIISYSWVTIFDHLKPIIVEQQPQTARLVEVSAERVLALSARSIFPRCLPRMMNCFVPRSLIDRIQERFGSVFASVSPDYNFCYRCLEVIDSFLYYDQAAFVSYAIPRANGAGSAVGIATDAVKDFRTTQQLGGRRRTYAAPVPVFDTLNNWILHEYCLVQQESVTGRFPKVSLAGYWIGIAGALGNLLAYRLPEPFLMSLALMRVRMRKIRSLKWPTLTKHETLHAFQSVDDAIEYASSMPSNHNVEATHLDLLQGSPR